MNCRDAILNGVKTATFTHERLGCRHLIEGQHHGNIDVFGSILSRQIPLVFRPLDGLLGACIGGRGVIISTQRPLSVQRFTAAHELGHLEMNHKLSLDGQEILAGQFPPENMLSEIEANAFASEFLLPRWLLAFHSKRQGWNAGNMKDPAVVYQLSLRVGASYEATIRSLEQNKIIDFACSQKLLQVTPKVLKQQLLPSYSPEHWYRDVWLITEKDEGGVLEGQPDDLFIFRLNEKTGGGYLWDFKMVQEKGFTIIKDIRDETTAGDVGSDVTRTLTVQSPKEKKGNLSLAHRRPWQTTALSSEQLHITYNLLGKEIGLARAKRPAIPLAA